MQLGQVLLLALHTAVSGTRAAPTSSSPLDRRACSVAYPVGVTSINVAANPAVNVVQDLTFTIPDGASGPCSLVATFPPNYPISSSGNSQVNVHALNGPAQGSLVGSITFSSSPSSSTSVTINSFACLPTMSYELEMANLYASVNFAEVSSDSDEITSALHAYGAALKSRNVDEAVALYTTDGVIMPPHFPASVGSPALREAYTRIFGSIQLDITFTVEEIVVMSPEWAFARTTALGTKIMLATQESEPHANQELFVMRKDGGEWRIARYAFSTMKPLVQNGIRRS